MHYRCSRALAFLIGIVACNLAQAEPIVGQTIAPLTIQTYGELVLDTEQDEVVYAPWSSECFSSAPQMHAVMYLPATFNADNINVPYTEMLDSKPIRTRRAHIRTTTILNVDTSGWGGPELVLGSIRYSKRKHPDATLVADADGQAIRAWGMQDTVAIMVLDQHGTVLFYAEGELSATQVAQVGSLLRDGVDAIISAESQGTPESTQQNEVAAAS